jgi:hypothetical protein
MVHPQDDGLSHDLLTDYGNISYPEKFSTKSGGSGEKIRRFRFQMTGIPAGLFAKLLLHNQGTDPDRFTMIVHSRAQ